MEQTTKNKKIIIRLIIIGVGVLAIAVVAALFSTAPTPIKFPLSLFKHPSSSFQPELGQWGCKQIELDPDIPDTQYNTVGSLEFVTEKQPDEVLEITKDGEKRMISLGKFRLPLEAYTLLRIPKFWLYFSSEALSDRDDKLYGLEDSYLSRMILKVGEQSREISLGKTGEHAFIELDDCPLGNIYPLNRETEMNFEILLEIGCNNFKDGACLNNEGKPLDYLNGADLTAIIRLFAISWQDFTKDISIPLHFKY